MDEKLNKTRVQLSAAAEHCLGSVLVVSIEG